MSDSLSQFQDVLGQMTFLKVYTQLCIGFPIAHSTEDVVAAIQKGAAKLTETFPWLAGQVINEGSGPGNSGLFKIIPYAKHQKNPPVIVKRLPNLDYQDIIEKKAPMSMLDGDILAPRKGIPASYGENEEPAEVFSIQANFIKGGLILTFAGQHNVMDMNGQGHLISLFAKAMRGELFSETEIKEGNRDRRNIISLLKDDEPLLDHSFMQVDPSNAGPPELHPATWVYFRFSKASLETLKEEAQSSISNNRTGSPFSINDIVTAFVWQRISAARLARFSPDEETKLSRAVNGRSILDPPLSSSYMGHCVTCTITPLTLHEITNAKLGDLSVLLRREISDITSYSIRSIATLVSRTPDKNTISYAAKLTFSKDLMLSSWAHQRTESLDFGPLGQPDFVKRQKFTPLESLCYLMPRTRDGDIDLATCLREDDLAMLANDKKWTEHTEYIG